MRQVVTGLWVGWNSQARWTTTSALWKRGASSSRLVSTVAHSVFGACHAGGRRARPSTELTAGSSASDWTRLVPTFPVAPTTTTRMRSGFPWQAGGNPVVPGQLFEWPAVGTPPPPRCHASTKEGHEPGVRQTVGAATTPGEGARRRGSPLPSPGPEVDRAGGESACRYRPALRRG